MQSNFNLAPKLTIAFAHATFNAVNTVLLFPFISQLAFIVTSYTFKWGRRRKCTNLNILMMFYFIQHQVWQYQMQKETVVMFKKAIANFVRATNFFNTRDKKIADKVSLKDEINILDQEIAKYLTGLFKEKLNSIDNDYASSLLDVTRDIERIADHAQGLVQDVQYQIKKVMVLFRRS